MYLSLVRHVESGYVKFTFFALFVFWFILCYYALFCISLVRTLPVLIPVTLALGMHRFYSRNISCASARKPLYGLLVWVSGEETKAVPNDAEHIFSLLPVVSKLNTLSHSSSKQVESVESEGEVLVGCALLSM